MRIACALIVLATAACQGSASPAHGKLELVAAPKVDEVAPLVARELAAARAQGRDLVVYVGASWCEPCTRFHEAAAAGALDETFPRLRLLVFDFDRDHEALDRAGYTSELIPLFVVPADDGRATGRHIEGGVKGDSAVAEITPRLRALLDK